MNELLEASNAELPDGFVELAPKVYAADPMWVPEDPAAVRRAFSEANDWYARGGESAAFSVPGRVRCAAFAPPVEVAGQDAYFGYFESTGDPAMESAVMSRVVDWAREQRRSRLYGPINFSTFGSYRVRLDTLDEGYTFVGEPQSPSWYAEALQRLGFEQSDKWVTQYAPIAQIRTMYENRRDVLAQMLDAGFRVERLSHRFWLDHLDELHGLVDEMFAENFGYTPLSRRQFEQVCGPSFIRKTCPQTSSIAFTPSGEIAGFFLVYPNWGPIICASAGDHRVNLDDLDYTEHWPQLVAAGPVTAVAKTAATRPGLRDSGVFNALAVKLLEPTSVEYDGWFGGLIRADNWSRRFARNNSADVRHYALFSRAID